MAVTALSAIAWSVRELELRRSERHENALDKVAQDILNKAAAARSVFNFEMLGIENQVGDYLYPKDRLFKESKAGLTALDRLGKTNESYQDFMGALFIGRASWGNRFETAEKEINEAHFELLIWGLSCENILSMPPENSRLELEGQEKRRKSFHKKLSRFWKAIDTLSEEMGEFLLAKKLGKEPGIF